MSNKFISARSVELLRQLRDAKMGNEPETVLLRANQWSDYIDYVNRRGAQPSELATLCAENARLRGILQFDRHAHATHRPSYALNCLYEGEITIAKFCEWMAAYVAGTDERLPDVPYRSCGGEKTPKELEAENARLREALANVHEGAARQLAEPRNHDDDQFALTSICTTAEAALAGEEK